VHVAAKLRAGDKIYCVHEAVSSDDVDEHARRADSRPT
jgi:hypothetical protein